MFYRVCLILNSVLSILLIVLAFYIVLIQNDTSNESLSIATSIVISAIFLICFNIICVRADKLNKEQVQIPGRLKLTGKVFFIFALLIAVAIILVIGATIDSFQPLDESRNKMRVISLIITIFLFLVLCFTTIANLIFFSRSLRKNKLRINELINNIGGI